MLTPEIQQAILDLREQGMSYVKIAKTVGVSNGSAHNISQRGYVRRTKIKRTGGVTVSGPVAVCPTCRARCYGPCLACLARNDPRIKTMGVDPPDDGGDPIELDLRSDDLERHKRLRAWLDATAEQYGYDRRYWPAFPGFE